jgi:uncharacterized protein (TIGR02466 family)
MTDPKIFGIFPIPIYTTTLNRKFTKQEMNFVEENKKNTYKNEGNITSKDTYVLNNLSFKNLKEEINFVIKDYFNKIISPKNNLSCYITQSWLNYTEETQFHHIHHHPNSFISGVLYFNADINNDNIKFHNERDNFFEIEPFNYNPLNSPSWSIPVETGLIILFPSSTKHSVQIKKGNNLRISLAFNVFIKGELGSKDRLNHLVL